MSTDDQEERTTVYEEVLYPSTSNIQYLNESETATNRNQDDDDNDSNLDFVDMPFLEKFNKLLFQRPGSRALSVPSYFPFATMNQYISSNLLNKSNNAQQMQHQDQNTKNRSGTSKSNLKYFFYIFTRIKCILII